MLPCCVCPGLHSSYATHHSPLDQDMRMAMSPDCHITPVYDDRAFQSPLYHSPTHAHHGSHSAIYRTLRGTATHYQQTQLHMAGTIRTRDMHSV